MKNRTPSLALNAALNIIRSISNIVFPLITYPYATRILLAENLGKVNFASAMIGYFSLLAGLGISNYAGREGIQYRTDRKQLSRFSSEMFTLNFITTVVSLVLLALVCVAVPKLHNYAVLIAIYSSTIAFSFVGVEWLYSVQEDYLYITVRSILLQLVSMVLMFLLVKKPTDFPMYAVVNCLLSVGPSLVNAFYSKKYIDLTICRDVKKVFGHVKSCLVFFSSSIASSIYSNIDTTMLGFFATDYHVGVYAVAVRIYTLIKTVLSAVVSVMVPRLTYYRSHDLQEEFNRLVSVVFRMLWTFLLPVVLGVILVAEELVWLISGPGYEGAVTALQILSFAIFFAMFASVINGCILIPSRQEKKALKTTVSAAVVNLVTNLVAIPLFQQNGAAATTALAECVVMMMGWRYARGLAKLEGMKKTILTSLAGCVAIGIACALVQMLPVGLVMQLILKIIISVIAYFAVLLITGNELIRQAASQFIKRGK